MLSRFLFSNLTNQFSTAIVFVIILKFMNKIGLSLYGTCSIQVSGDATGYFGVLIFFLYMLISFGTIIYIKKIPQDNEVFQRARQELQDYYKKYLQASCIIWGVLSISNFLA